MENKSCLDFVKENILLHYGDKVSQADYDTFITKMITDEQEDRLQQEYEEFCKNKPKMSVNDRFYSTWTAVARCLTYNMLEQAPKESNMRDSEVMRSFFNFFFFAITPFSLILACKRFGWDKKIMFGVLYDKCIAVLTLVGN